MGRLRSLGPVKTFSLPGSLPLSDCSESFSPIPASSLAYRSDGVWLPRLVHLSADYARDSGTTTTCPCELKTIYCIPCNRAVHPPIWSRGLDSVQTTGEKAACFHDATFAFDHEDNLDGQSDKQGNTRTERAAIYGKNLRWTGHQTGYQNRLSTLNCLLVTEREGALVSGLRIPSRET